MNDTTSTLPLTPARKRKAEKPPPAPRKVDAGILRIRTEANAKILEYRGTLASARILHTFMDKRLPKLTTSDKEKLFDALKGTVTPPLIKESQ